MRARWSRGGRLGLIAALALAAAGGTPPQPPMLLVVSIDGLGPALLRESRTVAPFLSRLLARGASASAVTGVWPTLTYPSHATIVTGASPRRHGVLANKPLAADGSERGWYWYAEDLRLPALWDVATAAGLTVGAVDWPVTVGARIEHNVAQLWRDDDWHDPRMRRAVSTPGLLAELERELGPYPTGYAYALAEDRRRAEFAATLVERKRPDLQFVYFSALDEVLHREGPDGRGVRPTLSALDGLVARVARASGDRPLRLVLVSDHGFAPAHVAVDALEALRRAGLEEHVRLRCTEGTAAFALRDPRDTRARARLLAFARSLATDPRAGVERVLTGADLLRSGGFPDADLVLALRPGHRFEAVGSGSLHRLEAGGTHGFAPSQPEMDAVFAVAGPGIAAGRDLGRIDLRDVGPTLAGLMGLELAAAEGRDLSLRLLGRN